MDTPEVAINTDVNIWTDDFLNEMRLTGDPLADDAARFMFGQESDKDIFIKLKSIATNSSFVAKDFPDYLGTYFSESLKFPPGIVPDEAKINLACNVFDRYGFHIVNLLFFKSLPGGYMAPYPAKVMATTQLIQTQTARRVLETAQMIFDVHRADWYKENGTGIVNILKVRLMHAGMRYAILNNTDKKWDVNDESMIPGIPQGKPINQEDLVLTLNLFSVIILEGLTQVGVELTDDEKDAYLYNWQIAGHFLGIQRELIPATIEQTWVLHRKICNRMYHLPNNYGPGLTTALLDVINKNSKGIISMRLLQKVTMYSLQDDNYGNVYKSLGFSPPSFIDRMIDSLLEMLTNRAQKRIERNRNVEKKFEKKNSYLGFVFFVYAKRAPVDRIKVAQFKIELFEKISKVILKGLQQQAVLSNNKKFFIDNRLVELWDLGGFSWGDDTDKVDKFIANVKRVGTYIMMVVAPVACVATLYEFYRVRIMHLQHHPYGKMVLPLNEHLPKFNESYMKDMLCLGLLFLATTVVIYVSRLAKSGSGYLGISYVLVVAGLLAWLFFV